MPEDLRPVFEVMLERIDTEQERRIGANRAKPRRAAFAQIAGRFTQREGIDVAAELKKLEKKLGKAAGRFELQRVPLDSLGDPQKAREIFAQLDGNGNGQIEPQEVAEPFQRPTPAANATRRSRPRRPALAPRVSDRRQENC